MGVELQRRFEVMKNCFGQLETDVDWIEYQSSRNAFYTSSDLPGVKPTGDLTGTLHLLCTGNRMHSLDFRIHVTHRNHHPPTFNKPEYHFFVPVTLTVGEQVGKMEVLAIDYGSPQLFTLANVTIVSVTDHAYEREGRLDQEVLPPGFFSSVAISPSGNFTFKVSALDANGETPSEWQRFTVFQNDLSCNGDCSSGGVPLCYYGAFNRLEQFVDSRGAHCQCFHGFVGVGCDKTDNCQPEKTVDSYGGLDWREASANATVQVPCPYNTESDKQKVERACEWNKQLGRAVWARQKEKDKCKPQRVFLPSCLFRFIRDLLTVPAFSTDPTVTAHFDQKIAEQAALVIDSVLQIDFDSLQGNTTLAKSEMWSILSEFSMRLPSPFTLVSPDLGLHLKAMQWVKDSENFDTVLGTKCRVKLPTIDSDHIVRSICMANASLFDVISSQNPVLSLKLDTLEHVYFTKMTIMLKPKDFRHNYTCVYFDAAEGGWSTRGIRRVDTNYHGFVKCEANHMGVFSLLPESYFFDSDDAMRDLGVLLPTVTTFISMICSIFLLFMAAVQKNQSVDLALLIYLFFVFMILVVHLVMLVAPTGSVFQVGDPFALSPSLHLILQFSIISVTATLYLVLSSIRAVLISHERVKEEDEKCCSRPCSVIGLGIFLPAVADPLPPLLFSNNYTATCTRSRHRGSSERFLSLAPAVQASLVSIITLLFLASFVVLFLFRERSSVVAILYSLMQILYSCCAFLFAGYVFRMRYLFEREEDGSTQSLERKRDISRALLDHVDVAKSTDDNQSMKSDSGTYLRMPQNLYDRAPMVSIV
ncbi:Latrophilin/CL-1-like GPS domain protein [Ostertagia ostertagi]